MADTTATPLQERPPDALPDTDDDAAAANNQIPSPEQPADPEPVAQAPAAAQVSSETAARLEEVLHSDVGVSTLLTRLKQSIASARDFASFLKKRSSLEEDQAQGLKKLARTAHDSARRGENRQGSYAQSYEEIKRIHERMGDHGHQFAISLLQMSEDLTELASNMERGRKHWKQIGLTAEKRVSDAEALAERAKHKYDSLAEQYDRARTGDRQSSGKFGLKGPKSAQQQEEELLRKVQNADADYATKVTSAQGQRQELLSTHRPQTLRSLQDLIAECDAGLTLQLQKFATFNEKLLIGNGLCVSPLKDTPGGTDKSLREVAHSIDNQKDFNDYILSYHGKAGTGPHAEIKYEKHPTLATRQPTPPKAAENAQSFSQPPQQSFNQIPPQGSHVADSSINLPRQPDALPSPQQQQFPKPQPSPGLPPPQPYPSGQSFMSRSHEALPSAGGNYRSDLPPLNPVFGVSLEELFRRDGTAVPMVVYQCIQAVELFGLDLEGIYRTSGSANHINYLKALFDNDSSQVDFTNPESFFHDVNSVAGLLKQFLRDLPDPLFTAEHYGEFIDAARIDDDVQRRDCLHAVINSLPDPNYATLRALTLHLNHVQERSTENRMTAGTIALSFGPTLMGSGAGANLGDAGWQARVIETILQNTFQIFDDD